MPWDIQLEIGEAGGGRFKSRDVLCTVLDCASVTSELDCSEWGCCVDD